MAATKLLAPSKTPSSSRPSAATISLTSSNNASASALSQARSTSLGAKICSRSNSNSPISPSTKAQIPSPSCPTMTRNPADLLLNEHLDYLKLTCVKEKLPTLGCRKRCQPLESSRLPGSAPSGRSSGPSTAHDCSAGQSRPFSSHQDPGRLPLALAEKNQSAPDPGPLPA